MLHTEGYSLSQIVINNELVTNLPKFENDFLKYEDTPCPVCGKVCPNDSYCINCGYVYDPILKKYQTHKQIEAEKEKQKEYNNTDTINHNKLDQGILGKKSELRAKMVKIGKEYKRQHGQVAEVGDIVRRKNRDGSYDKGSIWYVTKHGWRRSPSKKRKPSKSQIKRICHESKKIDNTSN
jgi:hypothetical protein